MVTYVKLFLLIMIMSFCEMSYSQNPYKLLDKAEINLTKGKTKKALRQIKRAETSSYCICGSCKVEVDRRANLLKFAVYKKIGEHMLSRQFLDSLYFFRNNKKIDSLKVVSYQIEYGKDKLSNTIDSALNEIKMIRHDYDFYVQLFLEKDDKEIRFKINYEEAFQYEMIEKHQDRIEKWRKQFIKSDIYKMIKEKS